MLSSLTLLTWNLWFGEFERDRRLQSALEIVRRENPDVVAFQEVVPDTLERIWATPWIDDGYYLTDSSGASFGGHYGTLMMSRVAPEAVHVVEVPTEMGRRLIAVDLATSGGTLRVAGMHLESEDSTAIRIQQLRQITAFLADADAGVLMGDLNFDGDDAEESEIPHGTQDVWTLLRPGERGATRDTTANLMAALHSDTPKTRRLDRIYLMSHTSRWRAHSIRIIGATPIDGDPTLLPSDHFGLVAELRRE